MNEHENISRFRCVSLAALVLCVSQAVAEEQRFESSQEQMGVLFNIVLYAEDKVTATKATDAAFARVKQLNDILSDFDPDSELSQLSLASPTKAPVVVGDDLWCVLSRAEEVSRRSDGAFDVTVGPLTRLWRRARRQKKLPTDERLAEARAAVGHQHVQLCKEEHSVGLAKPDMRLDLGGIAKGYAADEALKTLRSFGVMRALVDASGDIALGDPPPKMTGWKIAVAPLEADAPPSRFLLLHNCAIATSGDAWQYVEVDGRRFSHIVDPHTGIGLTKRSSVTVVAPNCMTADAFASAVSVLGVEKGLALTESEAGVAALIVRSPSGKVETHLSKRFDMLPHE